LPKLGVRAQIGARAGRLTFILGGTVTDEQTTRTAIGPSPETKITHADRLRQKLKLIGGALASIAAVGAIVGGLTGYWSAWKVVSTDLLHLAPAPGPPRPAPVVVSGGPTVAVFQFENHTGDAAHDSFADDLTRGAIAGLGKFGALRVLGRTATAASKGHASGGSGLGRQIGADYVVDGDLRKSGDGTRVVIELTETRSGAQLWSKTFAARPDAQDEIAGVASAMIGSYQGAIGSAEYRRIQSKPAAELTSYECIVQYVIASGLIAPAPIARARECLDPLVKKEPGNADAWRAFSSALLIQRDFGFGPPNEVTDSGKRSQLSSDSLQAALRAAELAPDDAFVRAGLAIAYWGTCQRDLLRREAEKAIALNPNDVNIFWGLGWRLVAAGQYDLGASMTEKAIGLTAPNAPAALWVALGNRHFARDEFQEALDDYRRAYIEQYFGTYTLLATTLAHLGRLDEAKAELTKLMKMRPGSTIRKSDAYLEMQCFEPAYRAKFNEGLRKAGLPE
jgi:TolB-like protein/Flp pilus assembly protein TadD